MVFQFTKTWFSKKRSHSAANANGGPPEKRSKWTQTNLNEIHSNTVTAQLETVLKNKPSDLLIAVAEKFNDMAREEFEKKYAQRIIYIENYHFTLSDQVARPDADIKRKCEQTVNFMRNFGSAIKRLAINYRNADNYDLWKKIESEIFSNCPNSLMELVLIGRKSNEWFDSMVKPFPKVVRFSCRDCVLAGAEMKIDKLFPNLERLDLVKCSIDDPKYIEVISGLKNLSIEIDNEGGTSLEEENIIEALELNSDIERLTLNSQEYKLTPAFLQNVINSSPKLHSLNITMPFQNAIEKMDGHLITMSTIEKFTLNTSGCNGINKSMPFIFDKLTELTLLADAHFSDNNWFQFIVENEDLIKLSLIQFQPKWDEICFADLMTIAVLLPNLTEFTICGHSLSMREMVHFINECKSLQRMHFLVPTLGMVVAFCRKIGDVWKVNHKSVFMRDRYLHEKIVIERVQTAKHTNGEQFNGNGNETETK